MDPHVSFTLVSDAMYSATRPDVLSGTGEYIEKGGRGLGGGGGGGNGGIGGGGSGGTGGEGEKDPQNPTNPGSLCSARMYPKVGSY